jgi:PIN domain nuclease of toxin-antitoxin system
VKLLLDTSAFLWWISNDESLSQRARDLISDGDNEVWFSAVSSWEIVIKASLGRVSLPERVERFLPKQLGANGFQVLPVHLRHTLRVAGLPALHRDLFDRLLIAQAIVEGFAIVSGDQQLSRYPVAVEW